MSNRVRVFAALLAIAFASASQATTINFSATNLHESVWRLDYTVVNDTLAAPIDYFVIDLDRDLFANLREAQGPSGWDILLLQPDFALPADGVFDALALNGGIEFGTTLAGFSVLVDYLGSGIPMLTTFNILDPVSFDIIDAGAPTPLPTNVPEPPALPLLGLAMLLALFAITKNRPLGRCLQL